MVTAEAVLAITPQGFKVVNLLRLATKIALPETHVLAVQSITQVVVHHLLRHCGLI